MSVRRLAAEQPEGFAFTPENLEWAKGQIKKYPEGRQASAVLALLWRAQEQMGGWLPEPALRYVADMLGLAYIRIYEIATFYTMFNLAPVGRYYVQVCGTTPCWLRGANAIKDTCRRLIGEPGHVTKDGLFSWTEVECLGACVNAPMAQINKDYYEDLTPESLERILSHLKAGRPVKPGPQNGRQASAPLGGPMTLLDAALYAKEEPEEELVGAVASLTDEEAKRPGKAANQRERATPKPPLGKGRKKRPR
jgi:NADH-quinone oxidoreductase subunit E